ncbi:MAG: hypothetical protein Q4C41_09060 [Eggerthellaceae bacterium]|nr:hypothetical protein [Eggerthellaceae bacterium]
MMRFVKHGKACDEGQSSCLLQLSQEGAIFVAIDLVEHNPMMKKPVAAMLSVLVELAPCDRRAAEDAARETWDAAFSYAPGTIVDALERAGAATEQLTVNGEPYAGTLEDIQLDESVPLDAQVEARLNVTPDGRALLASLDPAATLAALLDDKPHYAPVFMRMLSACAGAAAKGADSADAHAASDAGATRAALEAAVETDGPVHSPQGERVYPQFFIDALETAGGIAWQGSWVITEAGRRTLKG